MGKLIGFTKYPGAALPDDMIEVPVALFEQMHSKMAQLVVIEEAIENAALNNDFGPINDIVDKAVKAHKT